MAADVTQIKTVRFVFPTCAFVSCVVEARGHQHDSLSYFVAVCYAVNLGGGSTGWW
jgi:hypothetical protein